jgi:hypothetical protein
MTTNGLQGQAFEHTAQLRIHVAKMMARIHYFSVMADRQVPLVAR